MTPALLLSIVFGTVGPDDKVDFVKDIQPIFESRCYECHGPKKQKGRMRLDTRQNVFAPARGEPSVVPGKPEASLLYELVSLEADDPDIMPNEGDPLTKEQVDRLMRWIAEGATWPDSHAVPTAVKEEEDDLGMRTLSDAQKAAEANDTAFAEPDRKNRRRIIVNDDGDLLLPKGPRPPNDISWQKYLHERFSPVIGTQIDSYFLNIGATDRGPGIVDSLQSSMAYWAAGATPPPRYDEATRRYIREARNAKIEIFASIRMNDVRDAIAAGAAKLTYPLKVSNPKLLLGNEEARKVGPDAYPKDAIMRRFWPGLDWAQEEVRQHFLDFIASYCAQYDFDGLELDYFHHPLFFKLGEAGKNLKVMSEFVGEVRKTLTRIGNERGKPYFLTARVPDTPTFARRSGLDVEHWLEEGWLDFLVVGGGYLEYSGRLKQFIDLAHQHSVPAYPCLNHFRGPKIMHSIASNFWALGGDGLYLFNYFGITGKAVNPAWGTPNALSLRQIGDPGTLRWLDKSYEPDHGSANPYIGYNNVSASLPVRLIDGTPVELIVGDDVKAGEETDKLKRAHLLVGVANVSEGESITVHVNGTAIDADKVKRTDETSFGIDLPAASLQRGLNEMVFLPGLKSSGRLGAEIVSVRLSIEYHPQYHFGEIVIPSASVDEPVRAEFSATHAIDYIDKGATAWMRGRSCISCHTNGSYMVTRPALTAYFGKPSVEHREFFVATLKRYESAADREKLRAASHTMLAYAAAGLAEWDAHVAKELSPETQRALEIMFDIQGEKGDWPNLDCWPPLESDSYHSTTIAALATATAPGWLSDLTDEKLRAGVEKMKDYLRATEPPNDYGRVLLLWTAGRLPDVLGVDVQKRDAKKQELIDLVWSHQHDDGGWSIRTFSEPEKWGDGHRAKKLRAEPEFKNPPSDGHQTGLCVMALRDAGVPADDPRIQRAVTWLLTNQRESGRWWTRSLNTDSYHFITFSGTCYPILALAKCGALPKQVATSAED